MPVLEDHKRELMAQYMAAGMEADDAYLKAGIGKRRSKHTRKYANNVARELKLRIQEIQSRSAENVGKQVLADSAEVVEKLREVARLGMRESPITDRQGNIIGHRCENLNASSNALSWMGKSLGMFEDKVTFTEIDQVLSGKSNAEVMGLIESKLAANPALIGAMRELLGERAQKAGAEGDAGASGGAGTAQAEDVQPVSEAEDVSRSRLN